MTLGNRGFRNGLLLIIAHIIIYSLKKISLDGIVIGKVERKQFSTWKPVSRHRFFNLSSGFSTLS